MPDRRHASGGGRDWVALTLAIGVATALNAITVGVLLAAFHRGRTSGDYGLSENATQILIAAFGGIIGVLGGYIGGQAVERARQSERAQHSDDLQALSDATDASERPASAPRTGAQASDATRAPATPHDVTGAPAAADEP